MKPADRVRCTLGDSVLVGTYVETRENRDVIVSDSNGNWHNVEDWTVEVLPPLPRELPVGSVVRWLGLDDQVWVAEREGWTAPLTEHFHDWEHVASEPWVLLVPADQVIEDVKLRLRVHTSVRQEESALVIKRLAENYGLLS